MAQNLKLALQISASGGGQTVAEVLAVQRAFEQVAGESNGITRLAQALGSNYASAQKFANELGLTSEKALQAIQSLRLLNSVSASAETRFATLQVQLGLTAEQFQRLDREAGKVGQGSGGLAGTAAGLLGSAGAVAFSLNNITQLLGNIQQAGQAAYDALLAKGEEFNQQVLGTQTLLAGTTRITQGGKDINDPLARIQATQPAIKTAFQQIERDTEELVGVTSSQVNELFKITLGNAAALNKQSKEFPDAISVATNLTKGWTAALQSTGQPLFQARQEINSILRGQIDRNSQLALSLKITNEQVEKWKAEGRLVDELNARLKTFVAGNKLAAESITGTASNIKDVLERIQRLSTEPLLEPTAKVLDSIYKQLKAIEPQIVGYFKSIAESGISNTELIANNLSPAFKELGSILNSLGSFAHNMFVIIGQGIVGATALLGPYYTALLKAVSLTAEGLNRITQTVLALQIAGEYDAITDTIKRNTAANAEAHSVLLRLKSAKAAGLPIDKQMERAAIGAAAGLDAQIAALKSIKTILPENTILRDNEIKRLEAQKSALSKASGGIILESQLLEKLGDTSKQVADKIKAADRQIEERGGGVPAQFEEAVKLRIKLAEVQVRLDAGQLAANVQKLNQLRKDVEVEKDTQLAAADAIVKIYQQRGADIKAALDANSTNLQAAKAELQGIFDNPAVADDPRRSAEIKKAAGQQLIAITKQVNDAELAEISSQKAKVETLLADRAIGEDRAQKQLSEIQARELAKRGEQLQNQLQYTTGEAERAKLVAEIQTNTEAIAKVQATARDKERQEELKYYDLQVQTIENNRKEGAISEEVATGRRLLTLERRYDAELKQQQEILSKLAADDVRGQNAAIAKIAEIEGKRQETRIQVAEAGRARILAQYDTQQSELDAFFAKSLTTEADYNQAKAALATDRANFEIQSLRNQQALLGKADIEGRDKINGQIAKLEASKIKILEDSYTKQLALAKDAADKALDIAKAGESERAASLQRLVNNRLITAENADKERNRSAIANQKAELTQARTHEADLAKLANATRDPSAEREYQAQVRSARAATLAKTLSLLETEGKEQERIRTLALKAIEDESAKRARALDERLSQLRILGNTQRRISAEGEAASNRQTASIDIATKALERQNSLLSAQAALGKAISDAANSRGALEGEAITQALDIRKRLDTESNLSAQERLSLQRRLAELTGSNTITESELIRRKSEVEEKNRSAKIQALAFDQQAARNQLQIEIQKNDLAAKRLVIESKLAELKAKQAVLEARNNQREQAVTGRKSIEAAELAVSQAKAQAPGRERDRAVAEAESKLGTTRAEVADGAKGAAQGVDLAEQQVGLAKQQTQSAIENLANVQKVSELQRQTLAITQNTAIEQAKVANEAARFANELERAKLAASGIVLPAPGNFGALPLPNLTGPTQQQVPSIRPDNGLGTLEVIQGLKSIQDAIEQRPAPKISANFADDSDGSIAKFLRLQRAAGAI